MENIVPGTLQRLRAADIIRMAGLANASLGQEYYRSDTVRNMSRRGGLLAGIVDLSPVAHGTSSKPVQRLFSVEVELVGEESIRSWKSTCSCSSDEHGQEQKEGKVQEAIPALLCMHVAALLYQWLAQPSLFTTFDTSSSLVLPGKAIQSVTHPHEHYEMLGKSETVGVKSTLKNRESDVTTGGNMEKEQTEEQTRSLPLQQRYSIGPTLAGNLQSLLSQSSLSELRAIAREYDLVVSGVPRQQLAEAIQAELKKPDIVRRIATTLEKPQRQLLAALILAGGAMSDDDLRGLFERFSLGQPSQLQHVLLTLQSKALLFRTSLNASNIASRSNHGIMNSTLLDIGWYVPLEVCNALRVSVPITVFDVTNSAEQDSGNGEPQQALAKQGLKLQLAESSGPLSMLLVVARLLDGYAPATTETWYERAELKRPPDPISLAHTQGLRSTDGSVAIAPPEDLPSSSLLLDLQEHIQQQLGFLRFIIRMVHGADLFEKSDGKPAILRLHSAAAERLLGPDWTKTLRTLFEFWLIQTSYGDLYDLTEEHLRLRCRATSLGQPVLRSGELEAENSHARQSIVALLAQTPLDQWINFSSFARFVYRLNPLFLQQRQYAGQARSLSAPQWWLELDEGRPLRPLQLSDWQRAELVYLMRMLAGPLHWWGICDIATSADGRLRAFRLTPTAGWLLNGSPFDVEKAQKENNDYQRCAASLQVTDDGAGLLIASSVQNWSVIQLLETFAEPVGVQQELLCYRLSAAAFGLALGRGLRPLVLLQLLRLAADMKADSDARQAQLFSQIATRFEQWFAGYSRVRLYTGVTLLETADLAVMREVIATTSLEGKVVQNIHPTLCIVRPNVIAQIVDELKQRGQSPLLHDEEF
jgi:hypothetical protein